MLSNKPKMRRFVSWDLDGLPEKKKDIRRRIASVLFLAITSTVITYDSIAIEGLIPLLQVYFNITDSTMAIIRTCSSISSAIALILLWMFGDRLPRKHLMTFSLAFWLFCNIISLFSTPSAYWLFLTTRTLSAAASTTFLVLNPVIISDLFKEDALGKALMINSLAAYLGSEISNSITSWFVTSTLPWQSGLIPGPVLVLVLLILLIVILPAKRHHAKLIKGDYIADAKQLLKIKCFFLIALGSSFAAFYVRSFLFWLPSMFLDAWNSAPTVYLGLQYAGAMTINSIIELLGTLIGLPLIMWLAECWQYGTGPFRNKAFSRALPTVVFGICCSTLILSAAQLICMDQSYPILLLITFFSSFLGSSMLSLVTQMTLNISPPKQKAGSCALAQLIVGVITAPSAQLVGLLSDIFRGGSEEYVDKFNGFRTSFYILLVVLLLSAIIFIFVISAYPVDCLRAAIMLEDEDEEMSDNFERLPEESRPLTGRTRDRTDTVIERTFMSRRSTMDFMMVI